MAELNAIQSIEEIEAILAYELLKVSYIRESKIANVRRMKGFLCAVLVALLPIVFIHFWGLSHYKTKVSPTIVYHCDESCSYIK